MIHDDRSLPLGPTGTVGASGLGGDVTSAEELLEALANPRRPAWWRDALCRKPDTRANFFPERDESSADAKAICARCAVRGACLAFALDERITDGLWGGLSPAQRRALRRQAS